MNAQLVDGYMIQSWAILTEESLQVLLLMNLVQPGYALDVDLELNTLTK